ncbi:hypothetical protein N7931_19225 [Catenovulum sp. 2E275]|uniref:hypothetical protein n=1 Tax=Catenovulum sp. 2E275 TaxID=2980497 RepID=UPI0021D0FA17|nr:hypothetical protein [Catenovulum sp. 2E275]MCU4677744.1 hypothetical protein [Catenovulum sp. 2E275]
MEFNKAKLVINTLAEHGKSGCGIISLSNQTNISQQELREFLNSHNDFFCKIGNESKYTINSFSEHNGSPELMIKEYSKNIAISKISIYLLVAAGIFVFGYLLGSL